MSKIDKVVRSHRVDSAPLVGVVTDVGYHRNGICGQGFWTVTFLGHKRATPDVAGYKFVAVRFDHGTDDAGDLRIAVLRVDHLERGDANECWRGDNFAKAIDTAIDQYETTRDREIARLR